MRWLAPFVILAATSSFISAAPAPAAAKPAVLARVIEAAGE